MKINVAVLNITLLAILLSLVAACSTSVPKDDRIDSFGQGLPEGDVEAITEEYPNDALVLNDEGIDDADGDAVIDIRDKCNNEAPVDDASTDNQGCIEALSEVKTIQLVVEFPSNKSLVNKRYHAEIENLAALHEDKNGQKILIEGHTDSTGSRKKNLELSLDRARAVAMILVNEFNINEEDVLISGFGPDQPIATNKTSVGRKTNRRMLARMVYADRIIQHDWNIWSVELGDKKSQVQQYYSLLDAPKIDEANPNPAAE